MKIILLQGENMALVSVSEAARMTGQSRTHLYRAIKSGAMSTLKNELGQIVIDTSELFRIFPLVSANDDKNSSENCAENNLKHVANTQEQAILAAQFEALTVRLADFQRQIEKLEADKADWKQERDRLLGVLESQSEQVRLLTDQSQRAQAVAVAPPVRRSWRDWFGGGAKTA